MRSSKEDIQATLTAIILLNDEEKQQAAKASQVSYWECFKGTNWRRPRIILYANGLSQFIGATFFANGPYFLILAGVSPVHTSMLVEIGIAIGIFSSLVCFFLLGVVGRRPLILAGTATAGALYGCCRLNCPAKS
jgi:MFS transporter, SP family, general alpha glucoside:H+ symporter